MSEKSNQGNSGGNMSEILFFLLLSLFENSYNKNNEPKLASSGPRFYPCLKRGGSCGRCGFEVVV